jgi:pimeloyl-ACP methyl ester carboxylesterase
VAAIVLSGGTFVGSSHRNRLNVRLCDDLAARGFHALRFDWHGVGDSTGSVSRFDLNRPFTDDVLGAVGWLRARSIERFVLVGTCFGARTALAASERVPGLEGIYLISVPIRGSGSPLRRVGAPERLASRHGFLSLARHARPSVLLDHLRDERYRRLARRFVIARARALVGRRPETPGVDVAAVGMDWVSDDVVASLLANAARHVPTHLVFGDEDHSYREFLAASGTGPLRGLREGDGVRVEVLPGEVHGLHRVSTQEAVTRSILGWVDALGLGAEADRPGEA